MKKNSLYLNNQLCFALYSATNAIVRYYNKYLNPLGITYTQYLVFITLWDKDRQTIHQIANKLKLSPSTISPIIKRLVSLNFLEKNRNTNDERIVFVKLTKLGYKLEKKVSKVQELVVCKTKLSEIAFQKMKNELNILTESLEIEEKDTPIKKIIG